MTKYRKRPVVIDAYEFNNRNSNPIPAWLTDAVEDGTVSVAMSRGNATGMSIKTLEGEMTASLGDWIIMGVKGEIYPCKPDVFSATYDKVVFTGGDTVFNQQVAEMLTKRPEMGA